MRDLLHRIVTVPGRRSIALFLTRMKTDHLHAFLDGWRANPTLGQFPSLNSSAGHHLSCRPSSLEHAKEHLHRTDCPLIPLILRCEACRWKLTLFTEIEMRNAHSVDPKNCRSADPRNLPASIPLASIPKNIDELSLRAAASHRPPASIFTQPIHTTHYRHSYMLLLPLPSHPTETLFKMQFRRGDSQDRLQSCLGPLQYEYISCSGLLNR